MITMIFQIIFFLPLTTSIISWESSSTTKCSNPIEIVIFISHNRPMALASLHDISPQLPTQATTNIFCWSQIIPPTTTTHLWEKPSKLSLYHVVGGGCHLVLFLAINSKLSNLEINWRRPHCSTQVLSLLEGGEGGFPLPIRTTLLEEIHHDSWNNPRRREFFS